MQKQILILTDKQPSSTGKILAEKLAELDPELQITSINFLESQRLLYGLNYDAIINMSCVNAKSIDELLQAQEEQTKVFNKALLSKQVNDKYIFYTTYKDSLDVIASYLNTNELSYPCIAKYRRGCNGKWVKKITNDAEKFEFAYNVSQMQLHSKRKTHIKYGTIYQPFVTTSIGKDVRVILIGGKVVAAELREAQNKDEFRSNLAQGGVATKYDLTDEDIKYCEHIGEILGLDYVGLDLMFDKNNKPRILTEANSTAKFAGITKATGIDICEQYCKYILKELEKIEKESD